MISNVLKFILISDLILLDTVENTKILTLGKNLWDTQEGWSYPTWYKLEFTSHCASPASAFVHKLEPVELLGGVWGWWWVAFLVQGRGGFHGPTMTILLPFRLS